MNTAEKIYQEVQQLPEAEALKILDFVSLLKARRALPTPEQPGIEADVLQRKTALLAFFSRFQRDLSGFKFDREEANARR